MRRYIYGVVTTASSVAYMLLYIVFSTSMIHISEIPSVIIDSIPYINFVNNILCTAILLLAIAYIRKGNLKKHLLCINTALLLSIALLTCLITRYLIVGRENGVFSGNTIYNVITDFIFSIHILSSIGLIPLVLLVYSFGMCNLKAEHRALAKPTFYNWLFVNATGMILFLMEYIL